MQILLKTTALVLAATLAACGGGGGSPGTSTNQGAVAVSADPKLQSAGLKDAAGAVTSSIGASGYTTLSVTLTDPSGQPLQNQLVTVTGANTQVVFPEGASSLTNASGVATIKIQRASLMASGAGSLTVDYNYKAGSLGNFYPSGTATPAADKVITAYVSYQLAAANIALANLELGSSSLAAYGTRQASVQVTLNGAPTPTPVQVTFTATCGQISPTAATTNSAGVVTVSYSATDAVGVTPGTQGCSGKTVEITASTTGANAVSKTLNVAGAPATNMSFAGATPGRIYLANSGGITQSLVQFKLVDARGSALSGRDVNLTLKTLNGGIPKASLDTIGNTASVVKTTDAQGLISVPVFSGTVPTNVLVNAALVADASVQTDSAILTIASGRPVQARVSLALKKYSLEGFNVDGEVTDVTMSLADRQGNPVPDGTAVNFVTSGGVMIPPVCTTGKEPGDSRCTVQIRTQTPRPETSAAGTPAGKKTLGRVFILAYAAGEEDFVDANSNNIYDCGESFTDLGIAFRDDNLNGALDIGEFSVPRAASSSACGVGKVPSSQQGDGVWGSVDVYAQQAVVFASSEAIIQGTFSGTGVFTARVGDINDNSMPTGSSIALTAVDNTSTNGEVCTVTSGASTTVPSTLDPIRVTALLTGCQPGDAIRVEVRSPLGLVTPANFVLP